MAMVINAKCWWFRPYSGRCICGNNANNIHNAPCCDGFSDGVFIQKPIHELLNCENFKEDSNIEKMQITA